MIFSPYAFYDCYQWSINANKYFHFCAQFIDRPGRAFCNRSSPVPVVIVCFFGNVVIFGGKIRSRIDNCNQSRLYVFGEGVSRYKKVWPVFVPGAIAATPFCMLRKVEKASIYFGVINKQYE